MEIDNSTDYDIVEDNIGNKFLTNYSKHLKKRVHWEHFRGYVSYHHCNPGNSRFSPEFYCGHCKIKLSPFWQLALKIGPTCKIN